MRSVKPMNGRRQLTGVATSAHRAELSCGVFKLLASVTDERDGDAMGSIMISRFAAPAAI